MLKVIYVYFDLAAPYPGWEWRSVEILSEQGAQVYPIGRHRCMAQGIPIISDADIIWVANPMCLDIGVEIKKRINKPLAVQFLDIPKELFGSERWRIEEYDKVKKLIEHADYITAISKTTAKDVEERCGRKVDKVLYLGVDEDVFRAFKPREENYLVGVCRGLARQKHAEVLKEVAETLNIPLTIIQGQYSDTQKAKIISRSLFGIGASTLEGFGVYLCETAFYSKPFVAFKLPVFEEIWGKSATLVQDKDEMVEKCTLFIENKQLRRKKGVEMHKVLVEKGLTLQNYVAGLKNFLENYK